MAARFAGARPYGMLTSVPLPSPPPPTLLLDGPPLVAVTCAGAIAPRRNLKAPLLEMVRECGMFQAAYILDMVHAWLYGLDDDGNPVVLDGREEAEAVPTTEEAVELHEQHLRSVLDRHPGCRLVAVAYSMSAILTLQAWPRVCAYAAALGRPTPAAVLVGAGIDIPDWKKVMVAEYFSQAGLTDAGRYESFSRAHGPHFDLVLRCTRLWCSGEPLCRSTSIFSSEPEYRRARVTDPNVHFISGVADFIYELVDIFGPLTPPPLTMNLAAAVADDAVRAALAQACAAGLPARSQPPSVRPSLVVVPGDHFTMLTGEGLPATRAAFHYFVAKIAGSVAVPPMYASAVARL